MRNHSLWCFACCVASLSTSQAQSPKIDSITLLGGPTRIRLRFETDSLNYYRVEYATDGQFFF